MNTRIQIPIGPHMFSRTEVLALVSSAAFLKTSWEPKAIAKMYILGNQGPW
jgi:hypothetical protein